MTIQETIDFLQKYLNQYGNLKVGIQMMIQKIGIL